jgi:hypothetical protein
MATTPNVPQVPQAPQAPVVDAPAAPEAAPLVTSSVPATAEGVVIYPVGPDTAPCNWRIAEIGVEDDVPVIEAISNLSNLTFRGTTKGFSKYLKGM